MSSETPGVPLFANLNDADPVVAEAVSEARRTLPQFLEAASKKLPSPATYLVKVPFIDRNETGEPGLVRTSENAAENSTRPICHLWLGVTSVFDDLIFCSVGEAPGALHLERGASFVIESASIEDWLINHGGLCFGGFSLRVIRNQMRKDEQVKFDAQTGILEFKTLVL